MLWHARVLVGSGYNYSVDTVRFFYIIRLCIHHEQQFELRKRTCKILSFRNSTAERFNHPIDDCSLSPQVKHLLLRNQSPFDATLQLVDTSVSGSSFPLGPDLRSGDSVVFQLAAVPGLTNGIDVRRIFPDTFLV